VSWVRDAVDALRAGHTVTVWPRGHSMRGRIEDGQAVTLAPTTPDEVGVGDVILVRWKGNVLLHRVHALDPDRVQIGNNLGKVNGWVAWRDVLGRCVDA
jgi:hypothetical protein